MDFLYGHDSNFGDFEDPQPTDMLESNMFTTSGMEIGEDTFLPSLTDNDWFINSIFEEGTELVYNDKNLGETASSSFIIAASTSSSSTSQPPCIKSEHSYSSNNLSPSPLGLATVKEELDMALYHGQSSSSTSSAMDTTPAGSQLVFPTRPHTVVKCESPGPHSDPLLSAMVSAEIATSAFTSPTLTPTIILTTTTAAPTSAVSSSAVPSYGSQAVFPTTTTVHIKTDPADVFDALQEQTVNVDMVLPPTPPSSNGSDSDGSQSPQRSAPSSPQRQSPMPQSGVLILTEEEKRTLMSEGYPIPIKLPLTKQEEKNLKKVRRKIKNKISAQESRRKKKEYVEQLEKRVEAYNHENCDLKKKVETLQSDNRSLLGQLQKLQVLLTKGTKTAAASATQTGTALMVLVMCFAVFLGGSGMGPSSLNVGYHAVSKPALVMFSQQQPGPLKVQPNMGPGAPRAAPDTADDYTTPNLKSRVLMAFSREEPDDWCDEYRPLVPWDGEESCPTEGAPVDDADNVHDGPADPGVDDVMPVVSLTPLKGEGHQQSVAVVTIAMGGLENGTSMESREDYQAMMHPDIAVASTLGPANFTADLETA